MLLDMNISLTVASSPPRIKRQLIKNDKHVTIRRNKSNRAHALLRTTENKTSIHEQRFREASSATFVRMVLDSKLLVGFLDLGVRRVRLESEHLVQRSVVNLL